MSCEVFDSIEDYLEAHPDLDNPDAPCALIPLRRGEYRELVRRDFTVRGRFIIDFRLTEDRGTPEVLAYAIARRYALQVVTLDWYAETFGNPWTSDAGRAGGWTTGGR